MRGNWIAKSLLKIVCTQGQREVRIEGFSHFELIAQKQIQPEEESNRILQFMNKNRGVHNMRLLRRHVSFCFFFLFLSFFFFLFFLSFFLIFFLSIVLFFFILSFFLSFFLSFSFFFRFLFFFLANLHVYFLLLFSSSRCLYFDPFTLLSNHSPSPRAPYRRKNT